jgi:hypothetical protein
LSSAESAAPRRSDSRKIGEFEQGRAADQAAVDLFCRSWAGAHWHAEPSDVMAMFATFAATPPTVIATGT